MWIAEIVLRYHIDHELLMRLVERQVGDIQILRLIRAWLKAGVMEEGKVTCIPTAVRRRVW